MSNSEPESAATEGDFWIGFDLGGTKMQAVVLDGNLQPIGSRRRRTKGNRGAKHGVTRIISTIEEAIVEAGKSPAELLGIGIGCPGPLDLNRGIIQEAPNLGWESVAITGPLTEHFNCPSVILNDVDAGVYGETRLGAARNSRCTVGIFPGTGIGGGCVYEGQILHGRTTSCLEIGHIEVLPDGPLCGCGQRGCLEAVASRLAISAAAAQAAFRGQAPHLLESAGTKISEIRSKALAHSIAAGDVAVERIVRTAAEHIGTAVAGLVNLLAPDTILLGGGLVEAMADLFTESVERVARAKALPSYRQEFRIVTAELGDHATALGAAAWIASKATPLVHPKHAPADAVIHSAQNSAPG